MRRFLHDPVFSQTTFQAIEQVQRGGSDADRSLEDLTQLLAMGGQGTEGHSGNFIRHGQAREIESQLLEIHGGFGNSIQASSNLGIGLLPEDQASQQVTSCQTFRVG